LKLKYNKLLSNFAFKFNLRRYISGLSEDPLFRDFEFDMYDESGERKTHSGAYVMNDGGYHRWRTTMAGFGDSTDEWEAGRAVHRSSYFTFPT
jgi:hypothetical protein